MNLQRVAESLAVRVERGLGKDRIRGRKEKEELGRASLHRCVFAPHEEVLHCESSFTPRSVYPSPSSFSGTLSTIVESSIPLDLVLRFVTGHFTRARFGAHAKALSPRLARGVWSHRSRIIPPRFALIQSCHVSLWSVHLIGHCSGDCSLLAVPVGTLLRCAPECSVRDGPSGLAVAGGGGMGKAAGSPL